MPVYSGVIKMSIETFYIGNITVVINDLSLYILFIDLLFLYKSLFLFNSSNVGQV